MKNIFYLGFLFSVVSANAQNGIFEKVYHPVYHFQFQTSDLTADGTSWITGGRYDACYVPYVDKIDSNGNLLWLKLIYMDSLQYGWTVKVDVDLSGNIIAAGYLRLYDDVANPAHDFVASLNPANGNLNWIQFNLADQSGINMLVAKSGLIYFHSNYNGTLVYDASGNYLRHFSDTLICSAVNGDVVLRDSINNFLVADTAGNIIHQYLYADIKNLITVDSNHYSGFYQSHLCLFDTAFQITIQSTATIPDAEYLNHDSSGFYFAHGEPDYVIEHYSESLLYDTSFLITTLTPTTFRNPSDMFVANNIIGVAGNEGVSYQSHSFLKTISKTGNPNPPLITDAGIQNLVMHFDSLQWNVPSQGDGRVFFNASFDIKNFGTDTIHSVVVYYEFPFGINCWREIVELNYMGFSLMPDSSIHIAFNTHRDYYYFFQPFNIIINTCFWTAAPNNKIDKDMSNNQSCSAIVGINELVGENNLMVYPNPSNGDFIIEIPSGDFSSLKIVDLMGREIYRQEIIHSNQKIKLSGLNSGYYRIVLTGANKIYTSGIVIE